MLDTDVIFSRVLHELFGRIASELRLLSLVWSDELLAEAERVLVERKPVAPAVAARWVGYLRDAFPEGRVDLGASAPDVSQMTSDPADEHVARLAIVGGADVLIAGDRGYERDGLRQYGIDLQTPDAFLEARFADMPEPLMDVLREQASVWGGGRPIRQLLDALERAGAPRFAVRARETLGRRGTFLLRLRFDRVHAGRGAR